VGPVLVVTDIDGTLAAHGHVGTHTADAVKTLQAQGVTVVAATGRRRASANRVLHAAGLDMAVISVNGSAGHTSSGKCFHRHGFSTASATEIVAAYAEHGLEALCMLSDEHGTVLSTSRADHWFDWSDQDPSIHVVKSLDTAAWKDHDLLAVTSRCADPATAHEVAEQLGLLAETAVSPGLDGCWYIDATAPGVNKWAAVEAWICAYAAVRPTVVACGDAANDLALLEGADVAVVISGSAVAEMVDADHLIGPPESDGWADVVNVVQELAI
jgi:HAD superfamily hydrolase (TIGR01484 family)